MKPRNYQNNSVFLIHKGKRGGVVKERYILIILCCMHQEQWKTVSPAEIVLKVIMFQRFLLRLK